VSRVYAYRRIETGARAWPALVEHLTHAGRSAVEAAGGTLFGVFTGQIGIASNQGIAITAWPDEQAQREHAGVLLAAAPDVRGTHTDRLVLRARDADPSPPTGPGIYAHRWFEIDGDDVPEFVELSRAAWTDFEESHDANIIGLFETLDPEPPATRLLLLTRYGSLATWERSRRADTKRERAAWQRFLRRHQLVHSTVVATTLLALPA
jgi:hypothetical protein